MSFNPWVPCSEIFIGVLFSLKMLKPASGLDCKYKLAQSADVHCSQVDWVGSQTPPSQVIGFTPNRFGTYIFYILHSTQVVQTSHSNHDNQLVCSFRQRPCMTPPLVKYWEDDLTRVIYLTVHVCVTTTYATSSLFTSIIYSAAINYSIYFQPAVVFIRCNYANEVINYEGGLPTNLGGLHMLTNFHSLLFVITNLQFVL